MPGRARPLLSGALLLSVALLCYAGSPAAPARAQEARPPSACEVGCTYAEVYITLDSTNRLRLQGRGQCGNGCGRFYWVTHADTDEVLLAITDPPGGNWLFFREGSEGGLPLHSLVFTPDPNAPPDNPLAGWYAHREYRWDVAARRLVAPPPTIVSREALPTLLNDLTMQGFRSLLPRWINTPA